MNYFNFLKNRKLPLGFTYILLGASVLLFCVDIYFSIIDASTTHKLTTTLTAPDLLTLAALTITFYSLLYRFLEKNMSESNHLLIGSVHGMITTNILAASISIVLSLISTMGIPNKFIQISFSLLLISWFYNILIIIIVFFARIMELVNRNYLAKNIVDIIITVIFIFISLRIFFGQHFYYC